MEQKDLFRGFVQIVILQIAEISQENNFDEVLLQYSSTSDAVWGSFLICESYFFRIFGGKKYVFKKFLHNLG